MPFSKNNYQILFFVLLGLDKGQIFFLSLRNFCAPQGGHRKLCKKIVFYNNFKYSTQKKEKTMNQFMFTRSFLAFLKDRIDGDAQATVRSLCVAHIGRKTQSRFSKQV